NGILAPEVLNRWFLCEENEGDVVIKGKYGLCEHKAGWIVYMALVRQQVYVEMCLAKLKGWILSDRHKPPKTSYARYRSCTTILKEKLDEAKSHCLAVSKGDAANLLGYSAKGVLDCVFSARSRIVPEFALTK
nr:arginine--tRNA ligase, chloroplastic/mitochondrial [Tanacetum cinerariifolium]